MKIGDTIGTFCICNHSNSQHTKMNQESWDRLNKQMEGYKEEIPGAREKFWTEFLTGGSNEEWKCSECDCQAFKMDNLRYLEEKLKEKKQKL